MDKDVTRVFVETEIKKLELEKLALFSEENTAWDEVNAIERELCFLKKKLNNIK